MDRNHKAGQTFGFTFALVFAYFGFWPVAEGEPLRVWAVVTSGILSTLALAHPRAISPLSRLWDRIGVVLASIIGPLALAGLFFMVVTPIGIVMRKIGKDPLRLDRISNAETYWIDRDPPDPAQDSFRQQF